MKKRVFAAFLAVCMAMGMTGCSDGELDGLDTIDGETEEG